MVAVVTDVCYKMSLSIIRELGEQGVKVVACQSRAFKKSKKSPDPAGFFSKYVSKSFWLPDFNVSPEEYIDELYYICQKISLEENEKCVIIPVGEKTLNFITTLENSEKLFEYGLLVPTKEQLEIFSSKKEIENLATSLNIDVPFNYKLTEENFSETIKKIKFPCVVKPDCAEKLGLKENERYFIVENRSELREKIMYFFELEKKYPIVQEYIYGDSFGAAILASEGRVLDFVGSRNIREYPASGGQVTCCEYNENSLLYDYARKIVDKTNYSGIAIFEFKINEKGKFKLLDIDPYVWETYPMTRIVNTAFSYNWFVLAHNKINSNKLTLYSNPKRKKRYKMRYFIGDLKAIWGYLCKGNILKALKGVIDIFNISIYDATFEISDINPMIKPIMGIFQK